MQYPRTIGEYIYNNIADIGDELRSEVEDMEVDLIFKIAAVGILVSILSQVLKHSGRDEEAFLVGLAGLILVLSWIVPYIYELFETIQKLFAI